MKKTIFLLLAMLFAFTSSAYAADGERVFEGKIAGSIRSQIVHVTTLSGNTVPQNGTNSGWLSGFTKRMSFTIQASKVDATLTDYPVLLYLSTSSGAGSADVSTIF